MANEWCTSSLLLATALVGESSADAVDGVALTLAFDPATSEVTLAWTGSEPDFEAFRPTSRPSLPRRPAPEAPGMS